MRQVPLDGLAQSAGKTFARRPAQFASDLGAVHGVSPIMAGPVLYICDQRFIPAAGLQLGKDGANLTDHFNIALLAVAANVVALADSGLSSAPGGSLHNGLLHTASPAHSIRRHTPAKAFPSSHCGSSAESAFLETGKGRNCWSSS